MFDQEQQPQPILSRSQVSESIVFATFRLANSIPEALVEQLLAFREKWLRQFALRGISPAEHLPAAQKLLFGELDDLLDRNSTEVALSDARLASLVREQLKLFDGVEYQLLSYCIMPNHVHVLFRCDESLSLEQANKLGEQPDVETLPARIVAQWKSATASSAGLQWHSASFLHEVRDAEDLQRLVDYVSYNPIKAGLTSQVHEWPWCSANDRYLLDGRETAWLLSQQP